MAGWTRQQCQPRPLSGSLKASFSARRVSQCRRLICGPRLFSAGPGWHFHLAFRSGRLGMLRIQHGFKVRTVRIGAVDAGLDSLRSVLRLAFRTTLYISRWSMLNRYSSLSDRYTLHARCPMIMHTATLSPSPHPSHAHLTPSTAPSPSPPPAYPVTHPSSRPSHSPLAPCRPAPSLLPCSAQ